MKEEQDYVLTELVEMVNGTDVSIGLTIIVNGETLTGRLISNHAWMKSTAGMIREAVPPAESGVGLHSLYEAWQSEIEKLNADRADATELIHNGKVPERFIQPFMESVQGGTAYLHLTDARRYGERKPTGAGLSFRVRLTEVSAWTFGEAEAL